jgi:hypothetical protein
MSRPVPRRVLALLVLLALPLALSGCSVQRWAVKSVADTLTRGPDVYGTDEDPELVRDALPFGLKTMESLLAVVPDHEGLLLTLCQGFTEYSYAFVQSEGDLLENNDYARATVLHARALKLYLRARGYGLRGLEKRYPGISAELELDPEKAAARIQQRSLPMLYWTAASWGSAIALGKDQPGLVADLPAIRALMDRGLVLDEGYQGGAIHEALILLDALPEAMGGSEARARLHFARAVALSNDTKPSPYVTLATTVSVLRQDRGEFEKLLNRALEFDADRDPSQRLVTIVLQRKARSLLEHEDEFFVGESAPSDTTQTQEK